MYPLIHITEHLSWPTYGLVYLTAFLAGVFGSAWLATKAGVPFQKAVDAMFLVAFSGEIGARLGFLITEWRRLVDGAFSIGQVLFAGKVVLAGVAGGVLAAIFIFRWFRLPVLAFLDAALSGTALGMGIGRLACLAAGCCFGKPTDLWWGITFTDPLARKLNGTPLGVPLHPTQILQALDGLLLFAFLAWFFPRRRFDGQSVVLFMMIEGLSRFLVEFLRNDPRGEAAGLATSQWLGLAFVAVGAVLWVKLPSRLTTAEPARV